MTNKSHIFITSISVSAALLGDAVLYVLMPSRPEIWSLTIFQVGILLSANRFIRFFTNPASSYLANRFGVKKPFVWFLFSSLATLYAYAFSKNFILLFLARLYWGACWSVLRLTGQLIASNSSSNKNIGFFMSMDHSIRQTGAIGGAVVGAILFSTLGLELMCLIFGLLTLVALAFWAPMFRNVSVDIPMKNDSMKDFFSKLKNLDVLFLGFSGLAIGIVVAGLMSASIGHYLRTKFGIELDFKLLTLSVTTVAGLLLGFRGLADVVLAPLGGFVSDKFGRIKVLFISALIASLGLLSLGFFDDLFMVCFAFLLVFGGGVMLSVQLLPVVSLAVERESHSEMFSIYNTFNDVGSALGPLIGLSLIPATYLPALYQLCSVFLVLLVGLIFLRFRNKIN